MEQRPIDRALAWARAQGMNQTALANKLNANPQDVSNWKKRGLPSEWYERVASALGRSVDELLGREPAAVRQAAPAALTEPDAGYWRETARFVASQAKDVLMTPERFLMVVDFMAANNQPSEPAARSQYVKRLLDMISSTQHA